MSGMDLKVPISWLSYRPHILLVLACTLYKYRILLVNIISVCRRQLADSGSGFWTQFAVHYHHCCRCFRRVKAPSHYVEVSPLLFSVQVSSHFVLFDQIKQNSQLRAAQIFITRPHSFMNVVCDVDITISSVHLSVYRSCAGRRIVLD